MDDTKEYKDIYYKIAVLSFMIYLFFDFYGTAVPFRPRVEEVEEMGSSNVLNQVIYSSLFLSSFICLFAKRFQVYAILQKEKILILFLFWCIASIAWSIDPTTTAKRVFRTVTLFSVTLSLLAHVTSTKELLKYIKPILYLYVFSSVAVCLTIPGAIDPQFHTWRGFTGHKNILGHDSVICIFLSFFIFRREERYGKIIAATSLTFSIALLFGSGSVTSITSFLAVSGIGSVFLVDKIFKPIGLGRTVSIAIFLAIVGLVASILFFASGIVETLTNFAGKDVTFSGRTDLWAAMMYEISKHPYLGAGYQAFWSLDNPSALWLYEVFIWLPRQAHNGYIDILNELGLIGFVIFLFSLIKYFFSIKKLREPHPWKWLIIATLIINLQESTLFRPGHLIGEIVVISYFILFAQLLKQKSDEKKEIPPRKFY